MVLVKSEQDFFALLAVVCCCASQPEAVADTARFVVKRRTLPATALGRPITLENVRACVIGGLPACSSLPATQRVIFVCFHAPGCPTVAEQGRLSKKASGGCPSARGSMKRCQWESHWCPARVTRVDPPFSTACTVLTSCSHPNPRPSACQKWGSRNVSATGTMNEDSLSFRVPTE